MKPSAVSIRCKNVSNRPLQDYGITCGVPFPSGVLTRPDWLVLKLADDRLASVQGKVTERWPDGSVKWLVVDFEASLAPNENAEFALLPATAPTTASRRRHPYGIAVEDTKDAVTVTSAHYRFTLAKRRFSLFASYQVNGREMVASGSDIVVEDLSGKKWFASLAAKIEVHVLEQGPLKTVLEVRGRHTAEDDSEMLDFRVRYTARAGDPCCRLAYTFTNREQPETGVKLAGIRLVVPTALGERTTKFIRQSVHGAKDWHPRPVAIRENVEIIAGKAVNEAARARYGAYADGKVLIRNFSSLKEELSEYPYFLRPGNARTDMAGGLRQVYPYLGASGPGGSLIAWFVEMENHFPKAVLMERHTLSLDVWPTSFGEMHVRRGQSCETELYLSFAARSRTAAELEALYLDHEVMGFGILTSGQPPVQVTLDPAYVRTAKVLNLNRWLAYDEERYLPLEVKLGTVAAPQAASRGMWDFGDSVTPDRSWCHNNENDAILNCIQEYYRRADPVQLATGLARARHNAHVDFIAFDPDPLRQGTMPAHCPEHTDGATYPSHMWVDGLLAAYCVTGDADFRAAAIAVGENMRRWQKKGGTFYCDSRECGWPMLAYLRLHEHTREPRWLKAAGEVFEFYRMHMTAKGEILYDIPHGMGTFKQGYGEFITWRACFFFYELTGRKEVRAFLVKCLKNVYLCPANKAATGGGWASNDLFPAWALYALTGERRYLEDNYPFLRALIQRQRNFDWGGNDMMFYLGELDRLGELARLVNPA